MIRHRTTIRFAVRTSVLLIASGMLTAANGWAESGHGRLQLDPHHTVVAFHLATRLHDIHGTFQLRTGALEVDPATGAASGSVVVDATSGESDNAARDTRMGSVVLEAEHFPDIRFQAETVDGLRQPDGTFHATLHGVLTLHGADHAIAVPVEGKLVDDQLSATSHFTVPYVEWGLADPSILLLTVANTVDIDVTTAGHVVWTSTKGDHE